MGPFLPIMHDKDVLFHDSFSFQRLNTFAYLPSPTEVREVASRSANRGAKLRTRPPPVCFPSLGLLVKYGTEITSAEGQCLLFLRKKLPTVPVPKVFGWCEDDDQVFIYMELMEGITLEKSWDTLPEDDRLALCQQLRGMIDSWRRLSCDLTPPYIGHVNKQPLLDVVFTNTCSPTAGPFSSVSKFHDWFTSSYGPRRDNPNIPPHPYRYFLPDDVPIVFTHGDLHPSNIIVSFGPNPRVVAIIDWHQSGWYPAYWEYCKARWTSWIGKEWESKYLPLILDRHDCYDYWDSFILARGA